jgi:hypothetical protein
MEGRYEPLKGYNPFRILSLHSALSADDPIKCTLKICQLPHHDTEHHTVKFEAVSYVWGPNVIQHEVSLDGWPVGVRTNLWHFLLRRRHPTEIVDMWIDALCIDQANLKEKNDQVQEMGRIYEEAQTVIVWLGEEAGDSAFAMDLMNGWHTFSRLSKFLDQSRVTSALLAWFRRDYWTRTWVVQEFLLARDLSVVCGNSIVQWQALRQFCSDVQFEANKWRVSKQTSIEWLAFTQQAAYGLIMQRAHGKPSQMPLFRLLVRNKDTECYDPRDKIYALLNLASDCNAPRTIQVDYERDPQLLVIDVLDFLQVEAHEVFRYAQFLADLLRVGERHTQAMLGFAGKVSTPRTIQPSTRAIDAIGYEVGEVVFARNIHTNLVEELAELRHDPAFASSRISEKDLRHIADQVNDTARRRLEAPAGLLQAITRRSWPQRMNSLLAMDEKLQVIMIFTSGRVEMEILIGVSYGEVSLGDTVVQLPGYEVAFLVSKLADQETVSHVAGRTICACAGYPIKDNVTGTMMRYYVLQTEAECLSPQKIIRFRMTSTELLALLE